MSGAAEADWAERATAAVAMAVRTLTRVRVGGLGRRWDATKASSFILEPPGTDTGMPGGASAHTRMSDLPNGGLSRP
ncbi:hypothetical protein GCM10010302_13020 [Streptomyces polychromogenes]|uniref:Uncharacterized protein n=1 Tax=Streptomyces polychromogenes TaxID=67342 RepID=A0ABP3EUV3_9ACTN